MFEATCTYIYIRIHRGMYKSYMYSCVYAYIAVSNILKCLRHGRDKEYAGICMHL